MNQASTDARFWAQLLPLLEEERVIPIIGPDLLTIEADGVTLHLYEHLARRVSQQLALPGPPARTLNELACRFVAERWPLEDIYPAIKLELGRLEQLPPPASLRKLAEMRWFKLYISTTFDNFLWQAIDDVRQGGTRLTHAAAFALNDTQDLPAPLSKLQRPIVYQLFGRASPIQDTHAVTDEDLLEFVHALQIAGRRPPLLFDALADKHVLLVGGAFSPWLVRFFLRAVKHRDRLWQVRGRAGFVVDAAAREDAGFVDFLRHYSERTFVYQSGPADEFVQALWTRWKQRPASDVAAAPVIDTPTRDETLRNSVFLSYASEDRAVVRRIKAQFDARNIDAWFDQGELKVGDTWRQEIGLAIDAAAVFIPVISGSVTGASGSGVREFRVEWEQSLESRKRRPRQRDGTPARFILPVAVDDTDMTHAQIAPYFGGTQAAYLRGGELTDEFCATVAQLIKAAQLAT